MWYTKKISPLSQACTHTRKPHKVCAKNTLTAAEKVSCINELTLIHNTGGERNKNLECDLINVITIILLRSSLSTT